MEFYSDELPSLKLELSRSLSDFEVERVSLFASGMSAAEARHNMVFLLSVNKSDLFKGVSK